MARICGSLIVASAILFAAGCGGKSGPEGAFKEFQTAVKAKDSDKAWNLLSKSSQSMMDGMAKGMTDEFKKLDDLPEQVKKLAMEKVAKETGLSTADLKSIDGKKLFGLAMKNPKVSKGEGSIEEFGSATLEGVKVEGDKASGTVKMGNKTEPISFVKESGSWKVTLPAPK